jgi:hypothetical protein
MWLFKPFLSIFHLNLGTLARLDYPVSLFMSEGFDTRYLFLALTHRLHVCLVPLTSAITVQRKIPRFAPHMHG